MFEGAQRFLFIFSSVPSAWNRSLEIYNQLSQNSLFSRYFHENTIMVLFFLLTDNQFPFVEGQGVVFENVLLHLVFSSLTSVVTSFYYTKL